MIKAILFDIDGVLLDSREANIKFFQNLLENFGYKRPSKKETSRVFNLTMWDAIKFLTNEEESKVKEMWEFGRRLTVYPIELAKIPKDLKKIIDELSHHYKLGLVTSRVRRGVDLFFQLSKTRKYFDVTVSFEDSPKHKPDPEPLLIAARKLKIKPEEAAYVGDSELDLKAARAAGMKFILFSKKRLKDADVCINSFDNLPSAIARL